MDVVRMRVGHLLRRGWRATLFLALLAGLAGGIAVAAFTLGRRASTAFDRFLAFSSPSDLTVSFCPPDVTEVDERCLTYDPTVEAATARQLPEIESAGRAAFFGITVASQSAPERTSPVSAVLMFDADTSPMDGFPVVLAGRRPTATDEIAVNETLAGILDVGVNDEVVLTFASPKELGATVEPGESFSGPRRRARVVGVERSFVDLLGVVSTGSSAIDAARISAGPAFAASVAEAASFSGMAVAARGGDVAAAQAAIDEAFAGRLYQVSPLVDGDDRDPIVDAIRYEAGGMMVFGAITALAAAAFAGQAVSRQSRREWADGSTLRAIGLSDRDAGLAALLRGAVTGAIAASISAAAGIVVSALGPFGIAGQAEIDPGVAIDGLVLAIGAVAVLVVVTAATWWPVARHFRQAPHRSSTPRRAGARAVRSNLPPPAMAGVSMSVSGRGAGGLPTGTALAGIALAVVTSLTAIGLTASLRALADAPEQYGAPWDLSASTAIGNPDERRAISDVIGASPDVEAAAGIIGTDVAIGDQVSWFQAFQPIPGVDEMIGPVITAGRAPTSVDEIALGSTTMSEQGVSIGDTVELRTVNAGAAVSELTVVGTTIINDSAENNPGRGGVVTVEWIEENGEELTPDPFVVRLRSGADVERMRAELQATASGGVYGPQLQGAIRNVDRVSWVPFLLAALVGVLAIASLAHALVLSIRRQRGQLAVLKSLGFRRGQVRSAVAFHATSLVVVAIVVGVPLGIILGRWGWRIVADEMGVASPPVTPLLWLAVVVAGVVAVANLVAAYPAWRAAREPTARALRAE